MITFNRPLLMRLHILLATFIFPIVLMFLITGGLRTWGIKGSYETMDYPVKLTAPLPDNNKALIALVTNELNRLNLSLPTGATSLNNDEGLIEFEWRGSAISVTLQAINASEANLSVDKANWFARFMQLHKGKGRTIFKVYASLLAVALFMLLITGFLMAWQLTKYRKLTIYSTLTGFLVFMVLVMFS